MCGSIQHIHICAMRVTETESKREEKTFEKITAEHFENALNNFISKTKPKTKPY